MNLPNFWYGSCSYGLLWKNHTLYARKILIGRIFCHGIAEFCPFKANFRVLGVWLPNATMNIPNFSYESCSYGFLSENHTLYAGKILILRNLAHLRPIFSQNWLFWEFLTYNYQTLLWIFLIFGMEVALTVLFEKIILYMLGNQSYYVLLAKKWTFEPISSKRRYKFS